MLSEILAEKHPGRTFFTLGQIARVTAISQSSLREMIYRGELEAFTTAGGHYRIPLAAVDSLLKPIKEAA